MEDKLTRFLIRMKLFLNKDPRTFFKYAMGVLVLSFVLSIVSISFFRPKPKKDKIPFLFSENQKMPRQDNSNNQFEMQRIVDELEIYKVKREKGELTAQDSLRIEFLYNKYQKLKK